METEIVLQPILKDSQIPFNKILLLGYGNVVFTGKLKAITEEGHQFKTTENDDFMSLFTISTNKPTHFAILNVKIKE